MTMSKLAKKNAVRHAQELRKADRRKKEMRKLESVYQYSSFNITLFDLPETEACDVDEENVCSRCPFSGECFNVCMTA